MYVNTACHGVKHLCFQVVLADHQVMPKNLEYFDMEFIACLMVEGKVTWRRCEQLQNVLGCRNRGSAVPYCSMQKHWDLIHPLLRNGLIIFNYCFRTFLYDFYCLFFICRCLDFCRPFSKCKLLFGSDRSFLVWKLFPVSVKRRGQQKGHESYGFSQDFMMGPGNIG